MALSKEPAKRAKQLANLRPGPPAAKGNTLPQTHGAHSKVPPGLDAARAAVFSALAAQAPVRDAEGGLPAYDITAVELAASALARFRALDAHVTAKGPIDRRGRLTSAAKHLERVQRNLTGLLEQLGMTPRSRAALGVDLARQVDLATAMSEPDPAKRARLIKQAGLTEENE